MRALVLGGSVFVGKRLVRALLAQDAEVAVLNRGKTPTALPDGVEHLVADRTDTASMRSALGDRTWDAVFDVSGFVMAAGDSNIAELLDLFDGRVGDYVYVSSIMAYDQSLAGVFPWTEDLPSNPDGSGTYGGFKAVAEQAMLDRHAATGFPASVVRPAAIYGPDNNIFDMETPMFLRLLQRRPILLPHGGLVATSYGHVDDLCELMVAMVGQPPARGEVFNVTAEGLTSSRYVQELAAIVGAVFMLRFIGSLEHSAAAQAADAVGYTELFSLITWTSVGLMGASATFAGQNLGARNPERARHGVAVASRIGLCLAAIVGADPDIVYVPDDVLASLTRPVFGHLFGVRHHAIASIEKATSLLGFRPRYDFVDGHVETYAWFREQGWGDLSAALSDPVWGASWDFDAEAEVARMLR